jgi:hypothetical protein
MHALTVLRTAVRAFVSVESFIIPPIILLVGPPACGKTVATDVVCREAGLKQVHLHGFSSHMYEHLPREPRVVLTIQVSYKMTPKRWALLNYRRPKGVLVILHGLPEYFNLPPRSQMVSMISSFGKEVEA